MWKVIPNTNAAYSANDETGRKHLSKPVAMCNQETMEIIKTFPSASEAARQCGYKISTISKAANGKLKHPYGYIWKWIEKCND